MGPAQWARPMPPEKKPNGTIFAMKILYRSKRAGGLWNESPQKVCMSPSAEVHDNAYMTHVVWVEKI